MTTITVKMLRGKGACTDQVAKFAAEWPNGCLVCIESINRCDEIGIDWRWAEGLLTGEVADDYWAKCKSLADDYWAKCKSLADDYWAKCKPLADDYWAKCKSLLVAALLSMDEAGVKP